MKANNLQAEMPPVLCAAQMIDYFFEVGPTMPGGMSSAPITHAEILAWQENTGFELTSWESRTLRRMSIEYVVESQNATKPECPAPWRSEDPLNVYDISTAKDLAASMRKLAEL